MTQSIPVLVLKFREGEEGELDQRMDNDYIEVFAPDLMFLKRRYGYNNAYIIPIEKLLEDQIDLLKSRGAFSAQADILKAAYEPMATFSVRFNQPFRKATLFDYVCVFRQYVENRQTQLEAYTVPQFDFLRGGFSMFQRYEGSHSGGWTTTFNPWLPSS